MHLLQCYPWRRVKRAVLCDDLEAFRHNALILFLVLELVDQPFQPVLPRMRSVPAQSRKEKSSKSRKHYRGHDTHALYICCTRVMVCCDMIVRVFVRFL